MSGAGAGAPRRRVLFIHPSLHAPGGGSAVAAWMLQALAGRCDLALLSIEPTDLAAINRRFGTALAPHELTEIVADSWLWRLLARAPTPLTMLKQLLLYRHGRALAGGYDLLVATKDEADLGRCPGLQYVHFPWTWWPRPSADRGFYRAEDHRPWGRWLRIALYHAACAAATGFAMRRMRRNTTLVNSRWTGKVYARRHPGAPPAEVLHPPIAGSFPLLPWEERQDAFLAIGRLAPEKRYETILAILEAVRRRGHAVRLTVAALDDSPAHTRRLGELFARHASWITVHHNLERTALLALIARHRYGIHANPREPFGMAVAELAAGGCLVFAPDRGGVTDLVRDPRLRFATVQQAVDKICSVLAAGDCPGGRGAGGDRASLDRAGDGGAGDSHGLVADLRRSLAAGLPDLSVETFQRRIRQLAQVP